MPSRNPIGWVFWPITCSSFVGHVDRHVAGPLADRGGAALRRGREPLERLPHVHDRLRSRRARRRRTARCPASAFCSAFATADFSVLAICWAACFLLNFRIAYASFTSLPRIRSITRRILRGDWRTLRWIACAWPSSLRLRLLVGHQLAAVAAEQPGRARTRPACGPPCSRCTYTGTNLLPLCTAKVWPTNSGRMVLARLQVLTTRFSFFEFRTCDLQEQCLLDERALLDAACHCPWPTASPSRA